MGKSNIRSFRFSDEVAGILEAYKGKSFNDKFENLVLHCFWERDHIDKQIAQRKKTLADLDQQISDRYKQLYDLRSLSANRQQIERSFVSLSDMLIAYEASLRENVTQNELSGIAAAPANCVTTKK